MDEQILVQDDSSTIKLLLVEDDKNIAYIMKSSLEELIGGYEVTVARNGKEGLSLAETACPDIIVSDVTMPVMNGLEMVKKIRKTNKEILIMFASGNTGSKAVAEGYKAGVNNYIKKPFLPLELDWHIKALINLKNESKKKKLHSLLSIGSYRLDTKNLFLFYGSEKQTLTVREVEILEMLIENKGEIVKRETLLMKLWGSNDTCTSRSLDVFIAKIRGYLSKDPSARITNVKSVGLILDYD